MYKMVSRLILLVILVIVMLPFSISTRAVQIEEHTGFNEQRSSKKFRYFLYGAVTAIKGTVLELFNGKFLLDLSNIELVDIAFDPTLLTEIRVGSIIQAQGTLVEGSSVLTPDIAFALVDSVSRVTGVTQDIDLVNKTITILDQKFNLTDATRVGVINGGSTATLADLRVGLPTSVIIQDSGNSLDVRSIFQGRATDAIFRTIDGTVTSVEGNNIKILGRTIDISQVITFSSPFTCRRDTVASILPGMRVQIFGSSSPENLPFIPTSVEVRFQDEGFIAAHAQSIDMMNRTVTLLGKKLDLNDALLARRTRSLAAPFKRIDFTSLNTKKPFYINFKQVGDNLVGEQLVVDFKALDINMSGLGIGVFNCLGPLNFNN